MAPIPRESEIAGADKFTGFAHEEILPGGTDISRYLGARELKGREERECAERHHDRAANPSHRD